MLRIPLPTEIVLSAFLLPSIGAPPSAAGPLDRVMEVFRRLKEVGLERLIDERYSKGHQEEDVPLPSSVAYEVATTESGLDFLQSAGLSQNRYYAELMGQGAIFFDAEGDGDADVYLLSGTQLGTSTEPASPRNGFFLNDGRGRFADASRPSGLDDPRFSVGVCGADYDNDGDTDLYVTNFDEENALYRNDGRGKFADVAREAGVTGRGTMDASCAFADIDGDGWLDLYVTYYVDHSREKNPRIQAPNRIYCGPLCFDGPPDMLYRNRGDGTFEDISSGLGEQPECRSLAVAFSDLDEDGDLDAFTTCDRSANLLFENQGAGTFQEVGMLSGAALSEDGAAQAGMGVASGDFDNDGRMDIAATYFVAEANGLYRNLGGLVFEQVQERLGTAHATARYISWGTELFDSDLDGYLDWLTVNGHAQLWVPGMPLRHNGCTFDQPDTLLLNTGAGRSFVDLGANAGPALALARQSRGLAVADIDRDGDLDALVTNLHGTPELYRNVSPRRGSHWLEVQLIGTRSNRDGIGARVRVHLPSETLTREVHSGQSYLSQSDMVVHFGLGEHSRIPRLEIRWPSKTVQVLEDVPADQLLVVEEGDL